MITVEGRQDYQEIVRDLAKVVNKYSLEQESQTPDYILAEYMLKSLSDLNRLMREEPREDDLEAETATQYNPFTISIENMTMTIYNRGSQE